MDGGGVFSDRGVVLECLPSEKGTTSKNDFNHEIEKAGARLWPQFFLIRTFSLDNGKNFTRNQPFQAEGWTVVGCSPTEVSSWNAKRDGNNLKRFFTSTLTSKKRGLFIQREKRIMASAF